MKRVLSVIFIFSLNGQADSVSDETVYLNLQRQVLYGSPEVPLSAQKIVADALVDVTSFHLSASAKARLLHHLNKISRRDFEIADQIRLVRIDKKIFGQSIYEELVLEEVERLRSGGLLDFRARYELSLLIPSATKFQAQAFEPPTTSEIQDIFFKTPRLDQYKNGLYQNVPKIFMFCHHRRNYACLMLMKDRVNRPVYLKGGKTLWSQPALGYAFGDKPYTDRDGYTPSGVYEVNGVMSSADQTETFGVFRRLILEFIDKSASESNFKYLLPESSWKKTWWRESVFGREIGRNLLRIHGTGRKNYIPFSTYKPFVATRGCVAQRELTYSGTTYKDQRLLLDQLMMASGLTPKYQNETAIRALLYIVEIDNKKGAVDLRLLNSLGLR